MLKRNKIVWGVAGVVLTAGIVTAGWYLARALPIGTGYVAKYLCSSTFISGRDPGDAYREDVVPVNPLARVVDYRVDRQNRKVTATAFFGLFSLTAVYRDGCGCALMVGTDEPALRAQPLVEPGFAQHRPQHPDLPWPEGSQGPVAPETVGVDGGRLAQALSGAFSEPGPENPRKTRAVLVVYDGRLVAERYAPGFGPQTPLLGWSMSKSVTNALVGILVKAGRLELQKPAPVPEWRSPGDPRGRITLDQLLRMSSGLQFGEVYAPLKDVTEMLFGRNDFAAFAAAQPLEAAPDTRWHYSSGSANIVARIVRQAAAEVYPHYYRFMHEELFDRIGMYSALMEPDASGTFVGSSYTFATPRDWARFGLLYLQDGVWQGERLLPEGWVRYSTTPTPGAPRGEYGALFWLNAGAAGNPTDRRWPSAPVDAFAATGFQEQKVIVIPSKKLVLVRFGATSDRKTWDTDAFIRDVLAALPR